MKIVRIDYLKLIDSLHTINDPDLKKIDALMEMDCANGFPKQSVYMHGVSLWLHLTSKNNFEHAFHFSDFVTLFKEYYLDNRLHTIFERICGIQKTINFLNFIDFLLFLDIKDLKTILQCMQLQISPPSEKKDEKEVTNNADSSWSYCVVA